MRWPLYFVFLALTLNSLPGKQVHAVESAKPIVIGIFPRRNPVRTTRMFSPLVEVIEKKFKREVILSTPKHFSVFWDNVKSRKYDIVHFNQYHYVKSHKKYRYDVLLKNIEFGEDTIAGSIIVRNDSGIKTIQDLRGKKIIFGGGEMAMQSYITARYLLQENGLKSGDYIEAFANNPPNAIMSAYFRQSSAAGSGDKVLLLKIVREKIDTSKLTWLARGEQLAHLPWAVKKELPGNFKAGIRKLLLQLANTGEGKELLRKMHLDGFARAFDEDYNPHRIIINKVLGEKY